MLLSGLYAGVELGLNRLLAMDSTALPRLARLSGRVIAVQCSAPAIQLYLLPGADGLQLATHWEVEADCRLQGPAAVLLRLALADDKTSLLHSDQLTLQGDSGVLLELAAILQDLELDWQYELARWLGPVAGPLLAGHVQSRASWMKQGAGRLQQMFADYLAEETRTLVGRREAEARFTELGQLNLALDRLEARLQRLAQRAKPDA